MQPTAAPSNAPTGAPSRAPSNAPSVAPTQPPSLAPSIAPTPAPTPVTFQPYAVWANSYLKINLNIVNNDPGGNATIQLRFNDNQEKPLDTTNCGFYFDNATLDIIGRQTTCSWRVNPTVLTQETDLSINLVYSSDFMPTITLNSTLTLREGAFEYRYLSVAALGLDVWERLNESLIIDIEEANNPVVPNIRSTVSTFLGVCDPLILDASNTQNLGGREGEFYWSLIGPIVDPDKNNTLLYNTSNFSDNDQAFAWNELAVKNTFYASLNVSSWFGQNNFQTWSIWKDNEAQPQIVLDGPTLFSISNDNFDGNVVLTALLTFDDECLEGEAAKNLPYKLDWSVVCSGCSSTKLSDFLMNEKSGKKIDVVAFNADEYLEVSASYTFSVTMTCLQDYNCSVTQSLDMAYIFSEITCQITNSDMSINSIARETFLGYNSLYLDGNTFTNDPDNPDKSSLVWEWNCERQSFSGSDNCDYLFFDGDTNSIQTTNDAAVFVHFEEDQGRLNYSSEYLYRFTMTVTDSDAAGRTCKDTATLSVEIASKSADIDWITFNIEIIATATTINIAESLGLTVINTTISNPDNVDLNNDKDVTIVYTWRENTNQLTTAEIENLNVVDDSQSGNLIIPAGSLDPGVYQFNITIEIYFDGDLKGISSSAQTITVESGPLITDYDIDPQCENVTYNTLNEAFTTRYTMSTSAVDTSDTTSDEDTNTLVYGFSYTFYDDKDDLVASNDEVFTTWLQSQLLNRNSLENVLLPIGDFYANTHVFDADGTPSVDSMECSIQIRDDYLWYTTANCLYFDDILVQYFNSSNIFQDYETNRFIIYSAEIYITYALDYIQSLDDENIIERWKQFPDTFDNAYDCYRALLDQTLNTTHAYFGEEEHDFCGSDYSVQLSSLMRQWFDLRVWDSFTLDQGNGGEKYSKVDVEDNYEDYDVDSFDLEIYKMNSLIEQILDPCGYITEYVKQTKLLSVQTESIITNKRLIYYQNKDITSQLSPLLLEYSKYSEQLYTFAASTFSLLAEVAKVDKDDYYLNVVIDIVDLATKALYIAQLSRVSTSIAGDNADIDDYDEFYIKTIRFGTTSSTDITYTTPGFDVFITEDDLLDYIEACEQDSTKNNALCNGDVIIVGFNSTGADSTFAGANVGLECEELTGKGKLGSTELDITIVGQNTTDLDDNVTMTFNEQYNSSDTAVCVWLNETSGNWSDKGCRTKFNDDGSVTCYCNHLTTFATMHALSSNGACFLDDEFHIVSLFFIVFFLIIAAYIIASIYPFYRKGLRKLLRQEKALVVFQLILTICIINVMICIFFFIVDNEEDEETQKQLVDVSMILLVLPLFFYFVIFGLILYSWATVAHSLQVHDEVKLRFRLRVALYSSLGLVTLALIAQIVLVLLGLFQQTEQVILLVWCALLAVSALLYSIYGFLMVRLLVNTAKKMRDVVKTGAGSDMSLAKKLLVSAVCIWLFFILELVINLMFTFNWVDFNPYWRSFDLGLNVFCLIIICYMYHASIKRLRHLNKALACCEKPEAPKVASKTKDKSTTNTTKKHEMKPSTMSVPGPSHRQLSSHSNLSQLSNGSHLTITPAPKRKKNHKQISCVSITEVTELSNLTNQKSTQLIMKYDDSKRHSVNSNLNAPRLSALGAGSNTWDDDIQEDDENIVVDESLDMNHVNSAIAATNDNDNHLNGHNGHNKQVSNMTLPPPLPPQYTIDSNSEYEYEYYEEDDDGNQWNTNQNILYEE